MSEITLQSNNFYRPSIFSRHDNLVGALHVRGNSAKEDFGLSAEYAPEDKASDNRDALCNYLGFDSGRIAKVKQVHGDQVYVLANDYLFDDRPEADAIITNKPNWLLGVGMADCAAILLYDHATGAMAAIHSGRKGSEANIVGKTIAALIRKYGTNPSSLIAYVSPTPERFEYAVTAEMAANFDSRYRSFKNEGETFLDNRLVVHDQLLGAGIKPEHIEVDPRSSIADVSLESYRRDGKDAGRMQALIGFRAS